MTTARAAVRVAVVARAEVKWAEAAWEMGGEATVAAWTAAREVRQPRPSSDRHV